MIKALITAFICILLPQGLLALTVDEVLDKISAHNDSILDVKAVVNSTAYRVGADGESAYPLKVDVYYCRRPDKLRQERSQPQPGSITVYNGDKKYVKLGDGEVREITISAGFDAGYSIPPSVIFDFRTIADSFAYNILSDQGVGEDRVVTLRGVNDEGRLAVEVDVYYESGLVKEVRFYRRGQMVAYRVIKVTSHGLVDGIDFPTEIEEQTVGTVAGARKVLVFSGVELNRGLDDALFVLE